MFRTRTARVPVVAALAVYAVLSFITTAAQLPFASTAQAADWSTPVNISRHQLYDNAPAVAAAPNGAATVAWERRQTFDPSTNWVLLANSGGPGGDFAGGQLSQTAPQKTSGSVRARHDALGRRHIIWWQQDGSNLCNYYSRVEADGRISTNEQIPGTCGQNYKNTAMAIGPDNSVHVLLGWNLHNIYYWARNNDGWFLRGEKVPGTQTPEHISIGVTTEGTIMAAWKDLAPKGNTDIFTAVRRGPGNWAVENTSFMLSPGCEGNSVSYFPSLAGDPSGGMRMSWSDERCNPRASSDDPPQREIYYREWTPSAGWGAMQPFRVTKGWGNSIQNTMVVDASGVAHIVWVEVNSITLYYSSGRGTSFSEPVALFQGWTRGAPSKDPSLDFSPGFIHLAFTSEREDPQKDVYYSYLAVPSGAPPPPPPPPPAPVPPAPPPAATAIIGAIAPPVALPGTGSRTYPETGRTLSGLFMQYWDNNGGLQQQGFPISSVIGEVSDLNSKPYTVQYFERAVFEYHPEYQPPYNVLLSQLGTFRYKAKYGTAGAPNQKPNNDPGSVLFPQTGKRVGGSFLAYWKAHGGVAQQGYPISDEFTEVSDLNGKSYTVQYFERAVFEWHPEYQPPYNVLLSQLGRFRLMQKYGVK